MIPALAECKHLSKILKLKVIIDMMGHIASRSLATKMPELLELAKPWFDEALLHNYCQVRNKGMDWKGWLSCKKDILSIIMNEADLTAVTMVTDACIYMHLSPW